VAGEALTKTLLDQEVRDNIAYLGARAADDYELDGGTDYTTASTTWVDIDATNLKLTITPESNGYILIHFEGSFKHDTVAGQVHIDFTVGGTRLGGQSGIARWKFDAATSRGWISITRRVAVTKGVAVEVRVQWKTPAGNVILYNGDAAVANDDIETQFFVMEV
jgi:hypothetical protein